MITTQGASKNNDRFIALLHARCDAFPGAGKIHRVCDSDVIHKSKKTQTALAKLGNRIKLRFFSRTARATTLAERVWSDVHAHVTRNHRHPKLNARMGAVRAYLRAYDDVGVHKASLSRRAA